MPTFLGVPLVPFPIFLGVALPTFFAPLPAPLAVPTAVDLGFALGVFGFAGFDLGALFFDVLPPLLELLEELEEDPLVEVVVLFFEPLPNFGALLFAELDFVVVLFEEAFFAAFFAVLVDDDDPTFTPDFLAMLVM